MTFWGSHDYISVRLEFEVVAKFGKLDAVNAQFRVENEFANCVSFACSFFDLESDFVGQLGV